MIKLHLIPATDKMKYNMLNVQVRGGFTYATDARKLLKMNNADVFGKDAAIEDSDHFYFNPKTWQLFKFDTASRMHVTRDENGQPVKLTAFSKAGELGQIELKANNDGNNYPNCDQVIPTHSNPVTIGFDVKILKALCDAMGTDKIKLTFDLDNKNRGILCTTVSDKFTGEYTALLMPVRIE